MARVNIAIFCAYNSEKRVVGIFHHTVEIVDGVTHGGNLQNGLLLIEQGDKLGCSLIRQVGDNDHHIIFSVVVHLVVAEGERGETAAPKIAVRGLRHINIDNVQGAVVGYLGTRLRASVVRIIVDFELVREQRLFVGNAENAGRGFVEVDDGAVHLANHKSHRHQIEHRAEIRERQLLGRRGVDRRFGHNNIDVVQTPKKPFGFHIEREIGVAIGVRPDKALQPDLAVFHFLENAKKHRAVGKFVSELVECVVVKIRFGVGGAHNPVLPHIVNQQFRFRCGKMSLEQLEKIGVATPRYQKREDGSRYQRQKH